MLFRLKCHFCGARSKYSRGTAEFQCSSCEAWNFFDKTGDVTDPPARVAAAPRSQPVTVTPSHTLAQPGTRPTNFTPPDPNQMFCQTCLTNQRIYTESLANYLPDENHPRYAEYERSLPTYKADLERRYPQICKKCAPRAQSAISRADRYGLQQNVAKSMRDTSARGARSNKGQRDDWVKWGMRLMLRLVGWALYASQLLQVAWHAYSVFTTTSMRQTTALNDVDTVDTDGLMFEPTFAECGMDSLRLSFHEPCASRLSSSTFRALITSLILAWYNPGMALWYHHTIRVESVSGRSQYYFMQLMLLAIRTVAWLNLSDDEVVAELTRSQLLAAHGFMMLFMPLLQKYSERIIHYNVWRIRGKMMREPGEADVFGTVAGLERDASPPQASSVPPTRLFQRNTQPFPIENLAPRGTRSMAARNGPFQPPPSPPDSQSVSGDEMDDQMDWQPSTKPQMPGAPSDRTFHSGSLGTTTNYDYGISQAKGWTPMRNELFGIQSQQATQEQQIQEQTEQARLREQALQNRSPFRGTLPPDPMQRRLRGAHPQLQKQQQPVSERPDFYERMSKSFGSQRFGSKTPTKIGNLDPRGVAASTAKKVNFTDSMAGGLNLNDDDEDFSPVKSRSKGKTSAAAAAGGSGSLEFREGRWRLPDKTESTGLEDLFGGRSFRIADEAPVGADGLGETIGSCPLGKLLLLGVAVAVVGVGWNVTPLRRVVCLWLVERLDEMGY